MLFSKKTQTTCSFQIGTKNPTKKKFIVEPRFFTSWTIANKKCTRAHVQENKSIYLSIYLSILKPFWKRVYIYIYIYLTLKNFTSYISQVVPTYAGVPPLFLQCWQELILNLLFSDSFFRYQGGTYYFDNCSSSSIKVDTAIIRDNAGLNGYNNCICFSVKKENQHSSLLGRNCNNKLGYICEQSMLKKVKFVV